MKQELITFLYTTSLSAIALLTPVQPLCIAIFVLLCIDFVLGNASAMKLKLPIRSKEWKKTLIKFFVYELMLITSFILDKYFFPGDIIVRIAMMAIGLVESKSIFEHGKILTGIDIWAIFKDKLKDAMSASSKDIIKPKADETPKDDDDHGVPPTAQ